MPPTSRKRKTAGLCTFSALLVLGWTAAACWQGHPVTRASDLENGRFSCKGRERCWELTADVPPGWEVDEESERHPPDFLQIKAGAAGVASPPIRTDTESRIVLRLRTAIPLEVWWREDDGNRRRLVRLRPVKPPWSFTLHTVSLPQSTTGRVELRARADDSSADHDSFAISFAEILGEGEGRCYRDSLAAVTPPVTLRDAIACVPPAEVTLDLDPPAAAVRIHLAYWGAESGPVAFVHGSDGEQEHDLVRLQPKRPRLWYRSRVEAPSAGGLSALRLRIEGEPSSLLAWRVEPLPAQRTAERPNVLVYMIDTLRADALEPYGSDHPTPHLSALAAGGTTFVDTVAPAPWTLPSVVSLFSGRNVAEHGVKTDQHAVPPDVPLLAESLQRAGYRTVAVSTNTWISDRHGLHRGFDAFVQEFRTNMDGEDYGLTSTRVSDFAAPWISEHRDEPFFLYLHVMDPHLPYRIPMSEARPYVSATWREEDPRWDMARQLNADRRPDQPSDFERLRPQEQAAIVEAARGFYAASVAHCDRQLGRIRTALEMHGLTERTIILVVADHGEEFLEHGRTGHGHTLYGELLRIPAILSYPGRVPEEERITVTTGLVDFAPLLLSLAGVAPSPGFPTRPDRNPNRAPDLSHHRYLASAILPGLRKRAALIEDRWKLICSAGSSPHGDGVFDEDCELYERTSDPFDQDDRAALYPERVGRMKADLRQRTDQRAAPAQAPAMDAATRERLRALGYAPH